MNQPTLPVRLFPRRCSTQSASKQHLPFQKYKLSRLKRTSPTHPSSKPHSSLLLPQIKLSTNISTRNSSSKHLPRPSSIDKSSKPSILPDPLLIIQQQQSTLPPALTSLLKEFPDRRKNLNYIAELSVELREHNPLFRKLCEVISCCILRNSTVRFLEKGYYIYNKGDESREFFVILDGRVLLYNKKDLWKKICKAGEMVSEEVVVKQGERGLEGQFGGEKGGAKEKLQYAKCLTDVVVLEVRAALYNRLCLECSARGQKHNVMTLESLVMRNYLNKMSLRRSRFF